MKITKAVITAAGKSQRDLPIQTIIDQDGTEKSVLTILVEEALSAGVEEICVVVHPGDEQRYLLTIAGYKGRVQFMPQTGQAGYGRALVTAKPFVETDPFLHLVGDHLYVSRSRDRCAKRLVDVAEKQHCAVSAVHATRETMLPHFGCVGAQRLAGQRNLFKVERVIEKPTPTVAEQYLIIPGLRAGHYLCFFGMHVLTPAVMDLLEFLLEQDKERSVTLSDALDKLAAQEQYLALEQKDWRYDLGDRYGLLTAQFALALNGKDRDEILTRLLSLLAQRTLGDPERPHPDPDDDGAAHE